MRRIRIQNPILDKNYRTYLDADISSGTTLTVKSNVSFAANDFIVVGEPREELAELRQVASLSGNATITINSAFRFTHPKTTPIYKTPWDFVSIERRTSSAGVFAELSQSAIQWDNKNNETVYFDSEATASYEYRFRFYNSSSLTYSEYSDTITGAAAARTSVRYMVAQVRRIAFDEERKIVSDDEIIRAFNRAQDIIYAHNPKYWFLFVDTYELGSGSIAATVNEDVYTLNNLTRFGHLATLRYRYNSGGTDVLYQLERKDAVVFDRLDADQNTTDDNWPECYKLIPADATSDNGYFKVTPDILASSVGTFYPNYYEKMANLDSPADTTQVPLPDLLVDFGISVVERIKGNEKKAAQYESALISPNQNRDPWGLVMLDKMDNNQKRAVGQPQSVWRFKGQQAMGRLYGNKYPRSADYIRENYF